MISTSWGAPAAFTKGFNLQHVSDGLYGRHLHVYSWPEGELKQTLDRDNAGLLPLEAIEADNVMGSSRVDEFAEPVLQFGHR
ncbi:putative selenium-binding protein [Rosa chinensis]|uniref:Putative selenium-binding protein n=2 Tax=Rosa chinensis TaxID=74649 RepID=A0A2P6PB61_ROSCH|nr:putative selenium-binding protein [Rosa chinensis]